MIKPVILAGGIGSRLWPLSRENFPKQLLKITGKTSLLQQTVLRARLFTDEEPIVITNEALRFLIASQLQEIGSKSQIILEPFGKNTAPAVAIAALLEKEKNSILIVMPSDHYLLENELFNQYINQAITHAEKGKIICFGIKPNKAETQYGYIKQGKKEDLAHIIDKFIEKPNSEKAHQFVKEGLFWNSGIFMFQSSVYLKTLWEHEKEILNCCQKVVESLNYDLDFIRVDSKVFSKCPSKSIDYAIMEKIKNGIVIPLELMWNDLGSWNALHETLEKDEDGNHILGDVHKEETNNCYLHSEGRLVVALGIQNQVVVETEDAILVANKDKLHQLKDVLSSLKEKGKVCSHSHNTTYRPWGSYKSVEKGERFQVKRITVKPGGKLSLQMHHHRCEHWTIVKGTAKITKGDKTIVLMENESVYIPSGTLHRLENPGKIDLELIEVQTGSYLGEDDIIRVQDEYGRLFQT